MYSSALSADYDTPHISVVTAAQMQLGNHVGFWLLMGILFMCIASGASSSCALHQVHRLSPAKLKLLKGRQAFLPSQGKQAFPT